MGKYNLDKLKEAARQDVEEQENRGNKNNGYPLVYPVYNGKMRLKLLFSPKSGLVQRKIIRHNVGREKIPCMSMYGQDCPICEAVKAAEEEFGREIGAFREYGYKIRGISNAVLMAHDKKMFIKDGDPDDGDTVLFMYPVSIYNEIAKIINEAGANDHLESLVCDNDGKVLEIERSQVGNAPPSYKCSVYAYGDMKVMKDQEEFDAFMESVTDISEEVCPSNPTEEILEKVRAAAETVTSHYANNNVVNPGDNQVSEKEKVNEAQTIADMASVESHKDEAEEIPVSNDGKPDCFGNHQANSNKCLVCPYEVDCIL